MIAYMKGTVAQVTANSLILEVQEIGYQIFLPARDLSQLPSVGKTVKIYTYLDVKEDSVHLFGFLTEDEKELYQQLLNVSGIGPKAALGILSALTADELRFAILAGDAKTISKTPGIGIKTAQKLILELKDKLNLEDALEQRLANEMRTASASDSSETGTEGGKGSRTEGRGKGRTKRKTGTEDKAENSAEDGTEGGGKAARTGKARIEAIEALVALGYSGTEALRAVRNCNAAENMNTEEVLKLALRQMLH